jgi:hypothetical protein
MAIEERDHPVVQEIGCCDWRFAIIGLGTSDLRIGIDKGLLIDAPNALQT